MTRTALPAPAAQQLGSAELDKLQSHAADLRIKAGDIETRRNLLDERRHQTTGKERTNLERAWLDAQHDYNVALSELQLTNARIERLQQTPVPAVPPAPALPALPATPATSPKIATTAPPARDPFDQAQLRGIEVGAFVLMVPLVLALARRIWVRGGPRGMAVDLESSPRLQRMEQAIESIAIEVERIGEAQRFTTKLLAERDPVAPRIPSSSAPARREPGTITPH